MDIKKIKSYKEDINKLSLEDKDNLILSLMDGVVESMTESDMTERLTDKIIGNDEFIANLFMSHISKKEKIVFLLFDILPVFIAEEIDNRNLPIEHERKDLYFLNTNNSWLSDFDIYTFCL